MCSSQPKARFAQAAVRDWLETQARVTGYWRDVLVSAGGDAALIEALDNHAVFLRSAAHGAKGEFQQRQ
ncbi:hypothetical protein [Maricaulis sp. CAU 1757]